MHDDSAAAHASARLPADAARHTLALVLAGGRGARLGPLTAHRAKPALPFAGQLAIIDFTLSNCVNSGVRRVAVLTQYKASSLIRHIEHGWGFLQVSLGEFIDLVPAQQKTGEHWYSGTADSVYQNLDLLRECRPRHVLVLAGDHVYKMDYARLLADHVASGAPATVACVDMPQEVASGFGVLQTDDQARVTAFDEKPLHPRGLPGRPGRARISMGIYVFDTAFLVALLERDAADPGSSHDFGRDLLPQLARAGALHAHPFERSCVGRSGLAPYWRDVGTIDAYHEANCDLAHPAPALDLLDAEWPILSLQRQLPPARFLSGPKGGPGQAEDSLVASGCLVCGTRLRRSILFSKVCLGDGCDIEDSLLLPGVQAGRGVRLRRAIVDKRCVLPDGFQAGWDPVRDNRVFHTTPGGVVLITPEMLQRLPPPH